MWPPFVQWAKDSMLGVEPHLADAVGLAIPRSVAGVDEAIAIVREYHGQWLRDRVLTKKAAEAPADPAPRHGP